MIKGFTGPYRFLSNFYIEPDGTHVEGEYQRAKCADPGDRKKFHVYTRGASHLVTEQFPLLPPAQCKGIGRKVEMRPDWESVKVDVMQFYVAKKFRDHEKLAKLLKATGSVYLEETNTWGDTFWGVCNGVGENMLGHILMDVRSLCL